MYVICFKSQGVQGAPNSLLYTVYENISDAELVGVQQATIHPNIVFSLHELSETIRGFQPKVKKDVIVFD